MKTSSLPRELLKGLSHEMDLAFDDMNGQHQQTANNTGGTSKGIMTSILRLKMPTEY